MHRRDKPLVDAGHIPADRLFTLRPGEPVRDNVRADTLTTSTGDVIKVRNRPGGRACVFFDGTANACTTYLHRPLECRVLNCRDIAAIEAVYSVDRLQRHDLLGRIDGLWDLVTEHERRCSAARLVHLAERIRRGAAAERAAQDELLEMVRYDAALRQLLVESGRMAAGLLDLVLGRSLPRVLRPLGIALNGRGLRIRPGVDRWTGEDG